MDEITKSFRNNIFLDFTLCQHEYINRPLRANSLRRRSVHFFVFPSPHASSSCLLKFLNIPTSSSFICKTITFSINCLINEYGRPVLEYTFPIQFTPGLSNLPFSVVWIECGRGIYFFLPSGIQYTINKRINKCWPREANQMNRNKWVQGLLAGAGKFEWKSVSANKTDSSVYIFSSQYVLVFVG